MVLKLREAAPDNWEGAKCHQFDVNADNDPFFSEDEEEMKEAVNFCNGEADGVQCPLRNECLLFSLTNNERFGVWGGVSELGRKAIRKKYPSRGGRKNDQWSWMSEESALEGLDKKALREELRLEKEQG